MNEREARRKKLERLPTAKLRNMLSLSFKLGAINVSILKRRVVINNLLDRGWEEV